MLRVLFRQYLKPSESVFMSNVPVRNKHISRTPVPDTSKLIPLLDETQLFVPVVHRRHEVPLRKVNGPGRKLRSRHYVYDQIVPGTVPMPDVEVILVQDVPGKGVKGTKLNIPGDKAYAEFLIPQYAVYASPENELKYAAEIKEVANNAQFSTLSAQKTALCISQHTAFFFMNMKNPWTIEKWHARVAFRQAGIVVPEDCIELPKQPISGPDPDKQGKHFIAYITINGKERAPILCRINHFINDEDQKIAVPPRFTPPFDPVFEEDRAQVDAFIHNRSEIQRFNI
ncbi:39S ribosomal protein L9, mitochondrial [Thrips palmi]|uniref:Large ribosomal subunit protein bL9m n=1 Tax=Thrips palmi TaxID=161013 RepID=A0A6P9ABE4_THRPL|nr:39S ribosomal protein L9, mitochondrial [Thrips palmi]